MLQIRLVFFSFFDFEMNFHYSISYGIGKVSLIQSETFLLRDFMELSPLFVSHLFNEQLRAVNAQGKWTRNTRQIRNQNYACIITIRIRRNNLSLVFVLTL